MKLWFNKAADPRRACLVKLDRNNNGAVRGQEKNIRSLRETSQSAIAG